MFLLLNLNSVNNISPYNELFFVLRKAENQTILFFSGGRMW